jgi:DNA mismatch endonuclease (patch repair protein)
MGDVHSKETRSYNMSRIRGKNTKPELLLRKALWAAGVRFRIHDKSLPGKPDIVIKKYRLAIFVDGEFWHGYDWANSQHIIKSNRDFWLPKIESNIARDKKNDEALVAMGYTVFRFWEKDVQKNLSRCVNQVQLFIESYRSGYIR